MRLLRYAPRLLQVLAILALLFLLPWWTLLASPTWPTPVLAAGTAVFVLAFLGCPRLMFLGHGPRQLDAASRAGDTLLGVTWVLFSWSVIGNIARLALLLAGTPNPTRARIVAVAVLVIALALVVYGRDRGTPGSPGAHRRGGHPGARPRPGRTAPGGDRRYPLRPDRPDELVGKGGRGGERAQPEMPARR